MLEVVSVACPDVSTAPQRGRSVSVVTPVFNEAECLVAYYQRTKQALAQCDLAGYELVFVDDGSTDRSSQILAELAAADRMVKVITLSRNFGHHPAVFAGLHFASGEVIIILDADLQDPPELIPQLLAERNKGFSLVFARRRNDQNSLLLSLLKRAFRALMRRLSNIEFPASVGVFSAMDARLKDLLLDMPERERYLVAMQMYLGHRVGYVDYDRAPRLQGRAKQGFSRLFRLGMNALFSYSSLPLQCSMVAGLLCLIATIVSIGIVLYHKLVLHIAITGWTSVMIAILAMGAVQLLSLWIIGEYVDRIFENTKCRPYFIVWKQVGTRGCASL